MPIQDVALKTSRERWTIEKGGKRGYSRSVLAVLYDDDNGSRQLVKIDDNLNCGKYTELLKNDLISDVDVSEIFQHDEAPCHGSLATP